MCGFDPIFGKERSRIREANANDFAAELLIHKAWFTSTAVRRKPSRELLSQLADKFMVSLAAAALRYTEIGYFPTAILLVKERKIVWRGIHEKFPYQFCKIGSEVNSLSYTDDFFMGNAIPKQGEDIPAATWFPYDFALKRNKDARVWELVFPFPKFASALVMLWEV